MAVGNAYNTPVQSKEKRKADNGFHKTLATAPHTTTVLRYGGREYVCAETGPRPSRCNFIGFARRSQASGFLFGFGNSLDGGGGGGFVTSFRNDGDDGEEGRISRREPAKWSREHNAVLYVYSKPANEDPVRYGSIN